MSASTIPISSARFAAALPDLPLSSLHTKAAEIRNSIAHLKMSNDELQSYAASGDRECSEAFCENVEVINRMEERLVVLKKEVEGRGYRWDEHENHDNADTESNDDKAMANGGPDTRLNGDGDQADEVAVRSAERTGGRLNDEELARLLQQRLDEDNEPDADGIHL